MRASSVRPTLANSSPRMPGSRWPGSSTPVQGAQTRVRAVRLGHGDRPVEADDGGVAERDQLVVPRNDAGPVRRVRMGRDRVLGGDQRLHEVRRTGRGRVRREQPDRLVDLVRLPAAAVLVGEQHDPPVTGARVTPRMLQQHQGEQAVEVDAAGQEVPQQPGQPDPLARELGRGPPPDRTAGRTRR